SGDRAGVVYAPREFANSEYGMYAGAFAAVVDLRSGAVVKLDETTSLAHYNPGCGLGERVVFSALGSTEGGQIAATRLQVVNAAAKKPSIAPVVVDGQFSSPVPVGKDVVAAKGRALVEIDSGGGVTALSRHPAVPFRITPEAGGAIAFQTVEDEQSTVKRLTASGVAEVARAPMGTLRVQGGEDGEVMVVGTNAVSALASAGSVPATWRAVDVSASAEVSHGGGLAVLESRAVRGAEAVALDPSVSTMDSASVDPDQRRVRVTALDLTSAETVASFAEPVASSGAPSAAATVAPSGADGLSTTVDPATVTWDPDRTCAAPRNDPTLMVYQPTPEQVTWAANLAVQGQLTMTRAAGWNNLPLPAYSPQGQFPSVNLAGGGGRVPAQILLGILAQESNMWHASDHTADGYSGNSHQGGFYGRLAWDSDPGNDWDIHWDRSDCGYGVAQVTSGMRADESTLTDLQQTIVMTDYASNIAAGLRILQQKWNQTRGAGLTVNDGDPAYLENWWFAIWAYNTGFYSSADAGSNNGTWGLGWLNNPANEILLPERGMFLRTFDVPDSWGDEAYDYGNSKHPNFWSYPERVIGWAATPLQRFDFVGGGYPNAYEAAGWPAEPEVTQPGHYRFCTGANQCDENGDWDDNLCDGTDGDACLKDDPSPCSRADLHCWWHDSVSWVDGGCEAKCGTEVLEWDSGDARPVAPNLGAFEPDCSLPSSMSGARVIDYVDAHNLGPDGCPNTGWTRAGRLGFQFDGTATTPVTYPSKIDFHQIGGGFGGHFWFADTWRAGPATTDDLRVTGTWTLDAGQRLNGWGQVMVHLPGRHALTQQAHYEIHGVVGGDRERYLNTARRDNGWVQLGTYRFDPNATQSVSLSNITADGRGDDDIAWDAVAFVPLAAKPTHMVVAMGDSYISGEGVGGYYTESDRQYGTMEWNACRRSSASWPRQLVLPGFTYPVGTNADVFNARLDFQNVSCSGAM
ncbi:MAG TPA: transglycosylase SLT domain-containing protein, partial [Phytomonospora sp.]